jgi:hypothetical protein
VGAETPIERAGDEAAIALFVLSIHIHIIWIFLQRLLTLFGYFAFMSLLFLMASILIWIFWTLFCFDIFNAFHLHSHYWDIS